jgi:SAM-dependent methyltransferase
VALPFYGSTNPELFAIERQAMDRPGLVIRALESRLPHDGVVIDIGAGDGFTAARLTTPTRTVIPVEPAAGMRAQRADPLPFVAAIAQALPMADGSVDAAISTWAYFFTGAGWDPTPGLVELHRVVRRGGPLLIVDNLGHDEFTALAEGDSAAEPDQWHQLGFDREVIETEFSFTDADEASRLLDLYFGSDAGRDPQLRYSYRVGLFHGSSRGPDGRQR